MNNEKSEKEKKMKKYAPLPNGQVHLDTKRHFPFKPVVLSITVSFTYLNPVT
jgi:hypothetical protein